MTDAAIIAGSLVDVRNVGSAKSVKLTVHVPEEYARRVIDAFGWPTGAAPVSVAVARLDERKVLPTAGHKSVSIETDTTPQPDQSVGVPAGADKTKKSPAQIAGYLCTLPSFHKFLREQFTDQWVPNAVPDRSKEEVAKETLYDICTVTSRTQLTQDNTEWHALQLAFQLWQNHPELEDA